MRKLSPVCWFITTLGHLSTAQDAPGSGSSNKHRGAPSPAALRDENQNTRQSRDSHPNHPPETWGRKKNWDPMSAGYQARKQILVIRLILCACKPHLWETVTVCQTRMVFGYSSTLWRQNLPRKSGTQSSQSLAIQEETANARLLSWRNERRESRGAGETETLRRERRRESDGKTGWIFLWFHFKSKFSWH